MNPIRRLLDMFKKPAPRPHVVMTPDEWTWEAWSKEMTAGLTLPGWSPCRFAHMTTARGNKPDMATFVFGVTRGPFGLWQKPFEVMLINPNGENEPERHTKTLTCIAHLRSGYGLGVFEKRETAAQACDIAARIANFETIEVDMSPLSTWAQALRRTIDAWEMMGINPATNAHVYDGNSGAGPFSMFGLSAESANRNRPEKVS